MSDERGEKSARLGYQDLLVWREGMDLAEACYLLTREFPRDEIFGMTSQVRRAASSVPANIAEGYGREARNDYIRFLRIAQGSLKETETHLLLAGRVGLAPSERLNPILELSQRLGRRLRALIRSLDPG
jgi:four helix bundle protein